MKQVWLSFAWISLLLVAVMPAVGQTDQLEPDPLLTELALVPDNLPTGDGWASVRYADFQALYMAEGIEDLRLTADFPTLLDTVPLGAMLARLVAGPEALQYIFAAGEQMSDLVGFDWIVNVNRSLEFGAPPNTALMLEGTFDEASVSAALGAREFEQADVSGVTVWHRLEDAQMNLQNRDVADPFGGHLGLAARISILPDHLANSRYWALVEDIIAASQDEQDSLADNPNYRALAEAVSAPEGLLIQALFFSPMDLGFIPGDMLADEDPTETYGPLMPYALAVLADRQEGNDQVHLIGLVYADKSQAQAAAEEVATRLSTFSIPQQLDEPLIERFEAQVTASVYESESRAVAVVEVRYALPAERLDPETGLFTSGGIMYRMWSNAIMQRAFFLLMIQTE